MVKFHMTTAKDKKAEHHYFRVIVTYSDGETSRNRVFKDREKAEEWAARQEKSGGDKSDKLFPTRCGSYQHAGNLRRRWLDKRLKDYGFHSFRRFRITHLEAVRAHGHLTKVWAGHSLGNDVTKHYAKSLRDNVNLRMNESEQAGTGFIVPSAPKKPEAKAVAVAA